MIHLSSPIINSESRGDTRGDTGKGEMTSLLWKLEERWKANKEERAKKAIPDVRSRREGSYNSSRKQAVKRER